MEYGDEDEGNLGLGGLSLVRNEEEDGYEEEEDFFVREEGKEIDDECEEVCE